MFGIGSKLGVRKGAVDRNLVGLTGVKTDVSFLDQEYFMCNGKEPVGLRGGELVLGL